MTMGIPQEYVVHSGEAHMDLTRCSDNGSHPIKGLPDQDWLGICIFSRLEITG